jgi:hypothetical protein
MFRLLFRFVFVPLWQGRGWVDGWGGVVHKQKQSKARKKEAGKKTSGSRHVMDRTGQDRTLHYKPKATKGDFCFFPSFFFQAIPRTVLSIYRKKEVLVCVRLSDIPFLTDLLPSLRVSVWFIGGGRRDGRGMVEVGC